MSKTSLKLFALGGVAGPLLSLLVTLICASSRRDYNHINQFISELGATGTSNADLMNFAGFIPAGVIIALFGMSLWLLPASFFSRVGLALITLFGMGMTVVGFFSCDPGCPGEGSFENNFHDQISGPIFLSAITGILILGIAFRKIPSHRRLWIYSVLSSLLSLCFMIALINSIETYTLTGMWQRLLLLTIFLWFAVVGLHTYRVENIKGKAANEKSIIV